MYNNSIYPIEPSTYESLLIKFDLGSSVGESDYLLETAKIETQEFWDLLTDKIDIIRGIKGSGKTALFLLFNFLRENLFAEKRIYVISGVEPIGDPVFKYYQKDLNSFDELKFQNFWRIYFINLIVDNFLTRFDQFEELKGQKDLLEEFYRECEKVGIPNIEKKKTIRDLVEAIISFIKSIRSLEPKVSVTTNAVTSQTTLAGSMDFKTTHLSEDQDQTPIFVNILRDILIKLLGNCDIKIWIMLDRLDEVFLRRSRTEINGIRSLLKSAYSFSCPQLRIKVFLRDDIIEGMISSIEGFSGLTHIIDRSSSSIYWSRDQILNLVVKRIFSNKLIAEYFQVDTDLLNTNKVYRKETFYRLFPTQVKRGKNQPTCLDWIYNSCRDSNGIVTPRDVIDLIEFTKQIQYNIFTSNPQPQYEFISCSALTEGLRKLSRKKKESYLQAEFPHFWKNILKFQNGKAEHNTTSLRRLLGTRWKYKISELQNIGFIKFIPKSGTYKVPLIWRYGLGIKQGKAF